MQIAFQICINLFNFSADYLIIKSQVNKIFYEVNDEG